MLPEFSCESKTVRALVKIHEKFDPERFPQSEQRDICADRPQANVRIKIEDGPLRHERIERVRIDLISMRRVGCPIRICVMRRDQFYPSAVFRDPIELADERHDIRNMLDGMVRDDEIEFVIGKRIGKCAEIMDHIGAGFRIVVQTDRTFVLICSAADVENFHRGDSF